MRSISYNHTVTGGRYWRNGGRGQVSGNHGNHAPCKQQESIGRQRETRTFRPQEIGCKGSECVRAQLHSTLFKTPWTVVRQAFLFMGFSWQEYWSELPCRLQVIVPAQGSFWSRDRNWVSSVSCIAGGLFTAEPPGKPGKLQSMGSQRVRHDLWTEQQQQSNESKMSKRC